MTVQRISLWKRMRLYALLWMSDALRVPVEPHSAYFRPSPSRRP